MKGFLKKKWHRVPVGIVMVLMALILVAGSAFAAYNFLSFTTEITVDEPLAVEMRWWDYNTDTWTDWWVVTGQGDELTMEMSPAEVQTLQVRINNTSYGQLTVDTIFTGSTYYFTFAGWPDGDVLNGSDRNDLTYEWGPQTVTVTARGDTPPATYSIGVEFTRE